MGMNNRLLRPRQSGFNPRSISGLALWLDAADSQTLYTTDAGQVTAVSAPTEISGCALWLDGADATSMFDATTGGSQVAPGAAVARWQDKSGNGRHATQSSATSRPLLTSSGLNGRSVVSFDGSDDHLSFTGVARTDETWFVVARANAPSPGGVKDHSWVRDNVSGGAGHGLLATTKNDGGAGNVFAALGGFVTGTTRATGPAIPSGSGAGPAIYSVVRSSAAGGSLRFDGISPATCTTSNSVALATIGSTSPSSPNGYIAEVIIFDTALSTADRARVEAYLAAKWGISGVHAPATATNDPVGAWLDKSGNGLHFTQATAASRPVRGASINSRATIQFDGANDELLRTGVSNISTGGNEGASCFFVFRALNDTAYTVFTNTASTGHRDRGPDGTSYPATFRGSRIEAAHMGMPTADSAIVCHNFTAGTDSHVVRLNGARVTDRRNNSNTYAFWRVTAGTNVTYRVGNGPNNDYLNGLVAEVIQYAAPLGSAQLASIERYLASKWGITLAPQVSNADAQDWIDRVYANGGTVSATTASAVNTFCNDIDTAGIRDRFYRLNLFCGGSDANLNAVRTPLYRGPSLGGTQHGNTTDTNVNFVQADYAETGAGAGLTGNGSTKFLRTGFSPFAAGLVETNTHQSAYLPSLGLSGGGYMATGAYQVPSEVTAWSLSPAYGGGNLFYRSGGTQNFLTASYSAARTGHVLAQRTGAASAAAYHRGVLMSGTINLAGDAAWTTTNNPGLTAVYARSEGGTFWYQGTLAGYSMGISMTAAQVAAYSAAMQEFQTALGRHA